MIDPMVERRRGRAQIKKLILDLRSLHEQSYEKCLENRLIADAASVLEILVERLDSLEQTVEQLVTTHDRELAKHGD
jgi:hypothetical protein